MCLNCTWSENDRVYSWKELQIQYNININFMDYFSVLSAKAWKEKIAGAKKLDHIECNLIENIRGDGKLCKFFNKSYTENIKESPTNIQNKWEHELKTEPEVWNYAYQVVFSATKDTKLQTFQYKLIHRILPCNSFLYKCGLKETEMCTFCFK